ncbi:hypothetical protein [Rhizobium lentis]|uniref:Uncharacterized protein n=1 Tax=Rhizobium lentis TaxID=1138194 RepID=A0ABS7IHM5_9HYPH|nr:hypothetical protein [Rhizobium lentis]MBX4955955.1 hypothetical protein [Rhizobium lentis]MBX4974389.1 hypothetical protein [Rhizobium lentis]MBX4985233.1 hypothetical protein [Rhizobium lentis]MBX4996999.1 hypothetical protein [Rhizobium lentis]MBX5003678.1 hypothetical protein [Rhizobium lentis]
MILRRRLRHSMHRRPGAPGTETWAGASDVILVMMAGLLVAVAIFKILQG